MKLSAKAEYACLAVLELALRHHRPQPARLTEIAGPNGIPGRFLVQILLQLKTAGLVASVRGASGGYQLSRPPESISLASIINAIDESGLAPRVALTEANRTPTVEVLLEVWQEIRLQEQRMLGPLLFRSLLQARAKSH